ncbi:histidine phosphatase family protein [Halobacillus litoralis]|uniref:histidine phosphatase family protein n=1 Tax=Halobacillus litoralis TaxID=45668 RepID=UPI001F262275|nr:histidine phosphatase family protein [Halobacillus litoralis]
MELVFVRHGEGEHTEKPDRLHNLHPELTIRGENQARKLQETWPLVSEDFLIVSPTVRTLQTAAHWSEGIPCRVMVNPAVGPRMFPQKKEWEILPCDQILTKDRVAGEFPDFHLGGK